MKHLFYPLLALPVLLAAGNLLPDASFELGGADYAKLRYARPMQPEEVKYLPPVPESKHQGPRQTESAFRQSGRDSRRSAFTGLQRNARQAVHAQFLCEKFQAGQTPLSADLHHPRGKERQSRTGLVQSVPNRHALDRLETLYLHVSAAERS